jgi:putative ABC transport system permease protein
MFGANLRTASRSIQANRLRALLTTLGVIIGVAAVVTVSTLLLGVNANVSRQFASLGTNMLSINGSAVSVGGVSTGLGVAPSLTSADVDAVSQVAHVDDVTPVVQFSAQTIYGDQNWNSPVWGVYPNYLNIQSWQVGEGSWFSQAVIGILLGLLGGYGLDSAASANPVVGGGIPYVISPLSITIAFGVAVFVGVVFGFYPAARASRLDPIVVLRSE